MASDRVRPGARPQSGRDPESVAATFGAERAAGDELSLICRPGRSRRAAEALADAPGRQVTDGTAGMIRVADAADVPLVAPGAAAGSTVC
jgi:hypothetical protein